MPALATSTGHIACRASIDGFGASGVSIGTTILRLQSVKYVLAHVPLV
jgi:hypothetical protein